MWAINGIFVGAEDNVFYRRSATGLVESGGRHLGLGESAVLGRDVIHAVTNPSTGTCTGSIHIYGGDYLHKQRSMWDPVTHEEGPADGETVRRIFERARGDADS
jgi:predicted metal-dependent enzyme (double-stranded beta helix superfamily)